MKSLSIECADLPATKRFASQVADAICVPQTIALNGTLGVGKTQWIRFFAATAGVDAIDVTSPTYVLHQLYRGRFAIHHFDFYRLNSEDDVWNLGIDELFEQPVVVLIEWADRFPQCLPNDHLALNFTQDTNGTRNIALQATGPGSHIALIDTA